MSLLIKYGILAQVAKITEIPEGNYVIFENEDGSTITVTPNWTQSDVEIQYSFNGSDWSSATAETEIENTTGNQIAFRGKAPTDKTLYTANLAANAWVCPNTTKITGNLNFLLCDDFGDETAPTTLNNFAYAWMFGDCTSLTTAPELPATGLASQCYRDMFRGCASLETAPELTATELAGNCYTRMFFGCTSLTTAPELPAITLASFCYNSMFMGCTSLTTTPSLDATSLESGCYQSMFQGCTSLTTALELPATIVDGPCYANMFRDCVSLTTPPSLPATTLGSQCYMSMFRSCTLLTTVPELPAITLTNWCYREMFRDCSSLKVSETQEGDYIHAWRIPTEGEGTTVSNWNLNMLNNTTGTFTDDPEIDTTYYIKNEPVQEMKKNDRKRYQKRFRNNRV